MKFYKRKVSLKSRAASFQYVSNYIPHQENIFVQIFRDRDLLYFTQIFQSLKN